MFVSFDASVSILPTFHRAGILLRCEEGGAPASQQEEDNVLQQACAIAGCQPGELEASLDQLLRHAVTQAADASADGEGGSKRQRAEAVAADELPAE